MLFVFLKGSMICRHLRCSCFYLCQTSPMPFLHRSKSTSDIQAEPAAMRQVRYEELQKVREQIKESDDQWQNVSVTDMCTAQSPA